MSDLAEQDLFNEHYNEWIAEEKKHILDLLQESRMHGKPIDLENTDAVIVAAFHAGWSKAWSLHCGLDRVKEMIAG